MENLMNYEDYRQLSPDQKELHNFELMTSIYKEVKRTNGRVGKLEMKWMIVLGGLCVLSAVIVPIFLDLIKIHQD